jgi:hypothetical protein
MTPVTHPSPQQVREWMKQRQAENTPPPTPEVIRRELGWQLVRDNKSAECAR